MASGHGAPHQQAGHMAAPTSLASPSKKTLAKAEPSAHGTPRKWRCIWFPSAKGPKSDIRETLSARSQIAGDWQLCFVFNSEKKNPPVGGSGGANERISDRCPGMARSKQEHNTSDMNEL
jgi:hypothetical protein